LHDDDEDDENEKHNGDVIMHDRTHPLNAMGSLVSKLSIHPMKSLSSVLPTSGLVLLLPPPPPSPPPSSVAGLSPWVQNLEYLGHTPEKVPMEVPPGYV
jgi:hypothetical protein